MDFKERYAAFVAERRDGIISDSDLEALQVIETTSFFKVKDSLKFRNFVKQMQLTLNVMVMESDGLYSLVSYDALDYYIPEGVRVSDALDDTPYESVITELQNLLHEESEIILQGLLYNSNSKRVSVKLQRITKTSVDKLVYP